MSENLIEILKKEKLINTNNKVSPWLERKITPDLKKSILEKTSFLEFDCNLSNRVNVILEGHTSQPKCPICGKVLTYHNKALGFQKFCSKKCTIVNNVNKGLCKIPELTFEQRSWASKKGKITFTQRTGLKNIMHREDVKIKHSESIKGKPKRITIGKHPSHKHLNEKQIRILSNLDEIYSEHIEHKIPITELSKKYGFSSSTLKNAFKRNNLTNSIFSDSYLQRQFSEKLPKGFIYNDRNTLSGKELDIFYPENKLAIEIDGLYWHSRNRVDHLNKMKMANQIGIDLIRFTDKEIMEKENICISIINSRLGLNKKIGARNTEAREITNEEYKNFCDANHISGYRPAKFKIGLYGDEELLQVIGISKNRFSKNEQWELIRSCSKLGITVVGGLSKLMKFATKKYDFSGGLISFVDRRYFSGKSLLNSGFKFIGETAPNYWYVHKKKYTFESRIKYQKHKLKNILEKYDPDLSEKDNMLANGYLIYYDCGNFKYGWIN